jgi:hypothetical protein
MMIVSSAFLVTLFPSGAAAQDTTLLKDDRSPGKHKEGPCLPDVVYILENRVRNQNVKRMY